MTLRRRHRFILGSFLLFVLASATDAATYLTTLRTQLLRNPKREVGMARGVAGRRGGGGYVLFEELVQRDVER